MKKRSLFAASLAGTLLLGGCANKTTNDGSGNGSGRIGSGSKDNRRIFTGESVFKNILLPGFRTNYVPGS